MTPLDIRSLAVFRIACGLILICDLIERFRHFELYLVHHWSPSSSSALPEFLVNLLASVGDNVLLQKIFLAALLVAVCFYVVGYKTFAANAVTWFMVLLLHHFQPLLLNGGDKLLRLLLFWSLFLPVGKRLSVDSRYSPAAADDQTDAPLLPSLALMVQVIVPYVFSALFKLNTEAWRSGLGLYYSFTRDDEAKALGLLLAGLPRIILNVMNYSVLVIELLAPFLIFFPVGTARLRLILVIVFVSFHMGMFMTLDVGQFTFICSAGMLAIIPASVWGRRILPKEPVKWIRGKVDYVVMACLSLILIWNIESLPGLPQMLPKPIRAIGTALGLQQRFSMYSGVTEKGGWMTMPSLLFDGTWVDLFINGAPVQKTRPEIISKTFFSEHWRKLIERTVKARDQETMNRLADYYCRTWNSTHSGDKSLVTYGIVFMQQYSPADGLRSAPIEKNIFSRDCRVD